MTCRVRQDRVRLAAADRWLRRWPAALRSARILVRRRPRVGIKLACRTCPLAAAADRRRHGAGKFLSDVGRSCSSRRRERHRCRLEDDVNLAERHSSIVRAGKILVRHGEVSVVVRAVAKIIRQRRGSDGVW